MSGLLIGIILGAGYFTYKPLFKHLKANKFSPKDLYQSIKDNAEIRQEFKDFSMGQMEKIKKFLAKFSKGKEDEIVHYENEQTYTIKKPIQTNQEEQKQVTEPQDSQDIAQAIQDSQAQEPQTEQESQKQDQTQETNEQLKPKE